ncbi:glutamate receptor ionotropic, delta-2-like [Anopheles aquasalis]|uniref:glutamate receptor ionotropic, delta-2-like n=1 Tax=Anopheles aquasalis TaxID=42839 RepID=UPI00215AF65C|nr:glutamate receptor ionotropic, delta-2-like [Anopheles aquasalis]
MRRIGMWNRATGFEIWDNRGRYQIRRNLDGIDLNGIRLKDEETQIEIMREPNEIIGRSMWSSFAQIHNLSISTIAPFEKNVLGVIKANQENIQNFDYSAAAAEKLRSVVLFQHPEEASTRNTFLRPFSIALWLAIGAVFILVDMMIRKAQEWRNTKQNPFPTELLMIGVFCQQGFAGNVDTVSVRIMLLSVLIFTALLYQFYMAHIVGYLLVMQPKQIKSFEQLLENAFDIILEDSDDIEIIHKRTLDQMNVTRGISLIKSSRKALLCDEQRGYSAVNALFSDADRCKLQEISLFPEIPLHLALPKGSPYKDLFHVTLLKIIEHGVMQYERRRWLPDKPRCVVNEVKMPELNLDQTASVFLLLLVGIIGSMVVLLLEILVNRLTTRDKQWPCSWRKHSIRTINHGIADGNDISRSF